MHVLFRILIILCFFLQANSFAAEVEGLYETEVVAKSQSREDKNTAIKEALTIVLQRVLAGHDIFNDRAVRAALSNAPRYVKQYQYSLAETGAIAEGGLRNVRVMFDEPALLNLIKTGNLKVWSETRPETLVWLVVEENNQRSFFKSETMPEVNIALRKSAKQNGLPLLFPLMDIDEQRQLSVHDVLSAYPRNLLNASERYGVMSILAGRVAKSGNCWKTDWAFYFDQRIEQWSQPCGTLNDAVSAGLQGVYNKLSNYYAAKPTAIVTNLVNLKISGILGMEDRDRVTQYLKSLAMVKSVDWLSTDEGIDRYRVSIEGNRSDFEEMLGLGRVLNPEEFNYPGAVELGYQLLPDRFQ